MSVKAIYETVKAIYKTVQATYKTVKAIFKTVKALYIAASQDAGGVDCLAVRELQRRANPRPRERFTSLALTRQGSACFGRRPEGVGTQRGEEGVETNSEGGAEGVGRYKATWKREFKLPWRKAGPPKSCR